MKTRFNGKLGLVTAIIGLVGSAFGVSAPTGLSVAPIDYTQNACNIDCSAVLSWTAPTDGTPTGYKVYRRIAAHEQPTLAGEVSETSFTDSAATVGQTYLYTVTAVDGNGESAESEPVSFRRLENVALASKGNVTLNNPELGNGVVANANDGAINNVVLNGNSAQHLLILSFKDGRRPRLEHVRLNFGEWGTGNRTQKFYGTVLRNGAEVATEFNGSSSIGNHTFTQNAWNQYPVADSLQDDIWTKFTFGGGNWYGNCRELEAYGYLPSALLGTPSVAEPIVGDSEAVLSWTGAANAATYTVYRKAGEGAWEAVATGLTTCLYKDTGLTDGTTYAYRVAAVAANGDESSDEEGVSVTAQGTVTDIPAAYGLAATAIDFTQAACNIDCGAQLTWSLASADCYDQVRVYRFIKGHEDETPAPIATLDKGTTNCNDSAATAGREYLYKVACFDSATGKEGPLSKPLAFRKAKNVAKHGVNGTWAKTSGEPLTDWGNWKTWGNLSDGTAGKDSGIRIEGNGTIVYTWTSTARPKLVAVRAMSANMNSATAFIFQGVCNGSTVAFDGGSTTVTFPIGVWTVRNIASAYADSTWTSLTLANSTGGWQYPCFSEVEAYGYVPGDTAGFLAAPVLNNPEAGRKAVSLSWTAAANAASYKIYRKVADGDWVVALQGVTETTASDSGVAFDGTTYAYRVAAVAANGDELSSETKTVLCPAGAPFWWNFLNVKTVAFPGAAAYANPSQVKPHYMSRDKAGTLLVAPMSTDNGAHPAVTFDFAALASADNLGELTTAQAGMKQYGIFTDFGGGLACWKGAAVSADLVVIGNGAADTKIAVVERATGACAKYALLDESGDAASFTMDGGLDFDAAGEYVYSNDGTTKNRIVKWQVDAAAKTLRQVAAYEADDFTRIRNLAIYTVGGEEYAFFGEGSAKTGKIGAMKLSDGSFSTVVTDSDTLDGDIMNVKLAQADGNTYVVAQLDNAAVGVYFLDAATMTAELDKAIDADTMKSLYGTADGGQYRNFEMTADGRYALVMNNAGAATRLVVVGANEPLIPAEAPALTATADYSTKYVATLNWEEDAGVTAEAVRIFRAQVGKPGAVAVEDVPLGTGTYVDKTAVAGVPYAYSVAYVHTVNGKAIVGVRSAEAEATPLLDLKTKKTGIYRKANDGDANTLANLFDDNLATGHSSSGYGEQAAFSVSEPVQVMAARFAPTKWAASDTYPRADNMRIYGKRTSAGGNWYDNNKVLIGVGPNTVRGSDWVDFKLNDDAAPKVGYDYVTFYSGSKEPYLNLQEIDVYGALPGSRAAALAKESEVARTDAPTAAEAAGHALSWTESGALAGVRILRSRTAEGPWVEVGRVAAGAGTFADATAVDGVVYYYRIAYLNEFEGALYEGVPSATFVDYGVRLDKTAYRSAILQSWTDNWSGGYAFDDSTSTTVNGTTHDARFGVAFKESVVVNAIALRGPAWAVSGANGYRIDSVGIYAAPAGISGIADTTQPAYKQIRSASEFVQIGTTLSGCHTGDTWYVTPLVGEPVCSYLHLTKSNWHASINGMRVYGFPEAAVEAAKTKVVWPVANVAARMDDATLTLSWSLANDLATAITVKHRVCGGAWEDIAELDGDATTLTTDKVEIGKYNEYRFVLTDGTEVVWAANDFAVCPLLTKGTRTELGCTKTSAWDYLPANAASGFSATFELAGYDQASLGLTPGKNNGTTFNLDIRPAVGGNPAVRIQRHWVYGNTLGFYAYDPGVAAQSYTNAWYAEGNASTRFQIRKSGKSYQLKTAGAEGVWKDATTYKFVGKDPLGKGQCLVGIQIVDPNLATLPQIAPASAKVGSLGMALFVR